MTWGNMMPNVVPWSTCVWASKLAAVVLHDAGGDRQPEAGAGLLGREKGIEQPLFHLRGDAPAGILDFQDDDITLPVGEMPPAVARARKVMVPSWAMLSAASCTRLINTCLIWAGSILIRNGGDFSRMIWMLDFDRSGPRMFWVSCSGSSAGTTASSGSDGRANWRKLFTIRSRRRISPVPPAWNPGIPASPDKISSAG